MLLWFGNSEHLNWYDRRAGSVCFGIQLVRVSRNLAELKKSGLVQFSVSSVSKFSTEVFCFRFKLNKIQKKLVKFDYFN